MKVFYKRPFIPCACGTACKTRDLAGDGAMRTGNTEFVVTEQVSTYFPGYL